jgi:hypothetical protein
LRRSSGSRAASTSCPVSSAKAFTWKMKSSGVRLAQPAVMGDDGSA